MNSSNMIPNLMLIGLHHTIYWIRLGVQRVFGSLFSLSMRANLKIEKVLGLPTKEGGFKEISEILYKMSSIFKFRPTITEELGNQLVKNMTFLLKSALSTNDNNEEESLLSL